LIVVFNPFSTLFQPSPVQHVNGWLEGGATVSKKLGVAVIAARPAYRALVQHVPDISNIYFVDELGPFSARVLLDFPTTWSFDKLDSLNSVERARTLVVVQSPPGPYSDVVASYHVSGVVCAGDDEALISGIYAAAAALRTYSWRSGLTYMELRVTRLLLQGLDTGAVAQKLRVTTKTINAHVSNALSKLGYESRSQFVAALLAHHTA
jgi:DNA-binding CsgD family transcriptional regulator